MKRVLMLFIFCFCFFNILYAYRDPRLTYAYHDPCLYPLRVAASLESGLALTSLIAAYQVSENLPELSLTLAIGSIAPCMLSIFHIIEHDRRLPSWHKDRFSKKLGITSLKELIGLYYYIEG